MASKNNPGDWVQGSERFLRVVKKATGGGSAIARGKIVVLNQSTGVWAVASTGAKGQFGVVTHTNLDADAAMVIMTGGGTVYVTFDGVVKPDADCEIPGSTAGEAVQYVAPTVSGSPTQTEVQNARDASTEICGRYRGHDDEGDGSLDHTITDAADGDVAKLELLRNF
jgi:hypothetical protein